MKINHTFQVNTADTLLPFLLSGLSGRSRNYVKGVLKCGQVMIDGSTCRNHSQGLLPGQRVEVLAEAPGPVYKMRIPVIYEDDDIIAVDKPAGMLAIATDREREATAYHIVTEYVKSLGKSNRVFVVHRLDRETSGVMLLAKREAVKHALQENWDDTALLRGYIAVVEGIVPFPKGTMKSWLKQTKTLLVYSSNRPGDGKLAVTNYKTVQAADKYTMLDISLDTGRKNQIRVHMKDMGHPIAGDKKYGAATDPFGRIGLHASALTIKHPSSGEIIRLEASVPGAFEKVF